MTAAVRRLLAAGLLTGFASGQGQAQTPTGRALQQDLSEFEGQYHYRDGLSLVMVADGTQRVETIMLSGNRGQKVSIVPALELVVVFTGGAFNVESPVNTLMARVLLPALLDPGPVAPPPVRH